MCNFHEIPLSLTRLSALTCLDLSENALDPILVGPDAFDVLGHMSNLKALALDACLMSSLPEQVAKLPSLSALALRGNCLVDLPSGLEGLTSLDISLNHFPCLPKVRLRGGPRVLLWFVVRSRRAKCCCIVHKARLTGAGVLPMRRLPVAASWDWFLVAVLSTAAAPFAHPLPHHLPPRSQSLLGCTSMQQLDVSHNLYLEVTDWGVLQAIADNWPRLEHMKADKVLGPYQDFTCEHLEHLGRLLAERAGQQVLSWQPRGAPVAAPPAGAR